MMLNISVIPCKIFQFHKGAIRTLILAEFSKYLIYFNSIKVRLELSFFERQFFIDVLFQFHKGAIRTTLARGVIGDAEISIP